MLELTIQAYCFSKKSVVLFKANFQKTSTKENDFSNMILSDGIKDYNI
jgi:hypothetical protein